MPRVATAITKPSEGRAQAIAFLIDAYEGVRTTAGKGLPHTPRRSSTSCATPATTSACRSSASCTTSSRTRGTRAGPSASGRTLVVRDHSVSLAVTPPDARVRIAAVLRVRTLRLALALAPRARATQTSGREGCVAARTLRPPFRWHDRRSRTCPSRRAAWPAMRVDDAGGGALLGWSRHDVALDHLHQPLAVVFRFQRRRLSRAAVERRHGLGRRGVGVGLGRRHDAERRAA